MCSCVCACTCVCIPLIAETSPTGCDRQKHLSFFGPKMIKGLCQPRSDPPREGGGEGCCSRGHIFWGYSSTTQIKYNFCLLSWLFTLFFTLALLLFDGVYCVCMHIISYILQEIKTAKKTTTTIIIPSLSIPEPSVGTASDVLFLS